MSLWGSSVYYRFTSCNLQLLDDSTGETYCFNSLLLVTILFVSPTQIMSKDKNGSSPYGDTQIRATGIIEVSDDCELVTGKDA